MWPFNKKVLTEDIIKEGITRTSSSGGIVSYKPNYTCLVEDILIYEEKLNLRFLMEVGGVLCFRDDPVITTLQFVPR